VINKRQYPAHFYTDGDLRGIFVNWTYQFCNRRSIKTLFLKHIFILLI